MNTQQIKLLTALLADQPETHSYDLSYERIEEALKTGPALTNIEQEILWLSPAARFKYLHVQQRLIEASKTVWQTSPWGQPQQQLAASAEQDRYVLEFDGYRVAMDKTDQGWELLLTLEPQLIEGLATVASIKLVDDHGECWISCNPMGNTSIVVDWPFAPDDVSSYITRALHLEIV